MWRRTSESGPAVEGAGNGSPLLALRGVTVAYGAIVAVRDLTLHVEKGEIVALLGANGAGKSSTLASISGLVTPRAGRILFEGRNITRLAPEDHVRLGLSLTPEGRRVFASLSVADNLRLGGARRREAEVRDVRERLLDTFPVLRKRFRDRAGNLSGGEQQQLAIARSLMSNPKLLLLDEPSLGLAPRFVDLIFDIVSRLRDDGVTILLVEQNVARALAIADRAYVLATGSLQMEGLAEDLRASSGVERAYLGIGAEL